MNRRLWMIPCVGLALLGCDNHDDDALKQPPVPEPAEPAAEAKEEPAEPKCTYEYEAAGTKLTWTAFKLTERVGVAGTFKEISVDGVKSAETPAGVFEQATFAIDTAKIDTGNPERDPKILGAFFGTLKEGGKISGAVKSINGDKGVVELTLGGVTKPVDMALTTAEDTLTATGKIDVTEFGGAEAIAALNKVCEVQHTGPDKVSKLWPDVELKVESQLKKTCQ